MIGNSYVQVVRATINFAEGNTHGIALSGADMVEFIAQDDMTGLDLHECVAHGDMHRLNASVSSV